MDIREIRVGDYIIDLSTQTEMRAGVSEISCASLFSQVPLVPRFLSRFKVEEVGGCKKYFRQEGDDCVSIMNCGDNWELSIHTPNAKYEGKIQYVSEMQHILADCGIHWRCD